MLLSTRFINYLHNIIIGKLREIDGSPLSWVMRDVSPIVVQAN